jgi:hypothetical protein
VNGKLLLVVITVCVLGGAISGLVVVWVQEEPAAPTQEPSPQQTERPRAKSHYIKPGIERKI